jgi:hypothetical protein
VRLQAQVLAAERDDLGCLAVAGLAAEEVGLQPGADDQAVHLVGPLVRDDGDAADSAAGTGVLHDAGDRGGQEDPPAVLGHVLAEGPGDRLVVDDRGAGGQQGGDARDVGLEFAQLGLLQPADARDAVGQGAALQFAELDGLGLATRDDELAALVVGEPLLLAVRLEEPDALAGQGRLGGAGGVVDAGVDDAGVAAGLVLGDLVFLLEDGHGVARGGQLARDGEPDDAGADDSDVLGFGHNHENRTAAVLIRV